MKKMKKTILKAVVVAALLCPSVYADGDMGSGGKTCQNGQPTCLTNGDMGSGGLSSSSDETTYLDSVISTIYDYFDWTM